MNALTRYVELIVEPTVEEFTRNPTSLRHCFLACVTAYHSVDRVSYPKNAEGVAKEWRRQSEAFALVEVVALDFKHVMNRKHKQRTVPPRIPTGAALYGQAAFNTHMYNDTGQVDTLQHMTFIVRDAVVFIKGQAALLKVD